MTEWNNMVTNTIIMRKVKELSHLYKNGLLAKLTVQAH